MTASIETHHARKASSLPRILKSWDAVLKANGVHVDLDRVVGCPTLLAFDAYFLLDLDYEIFRNINRVVLGSLYCHPTALGGFASLDLLLGLQSFPSSIQDRMFVLERLALGSWPLRGISAGRAQCQDAYLALGLLHPAVVLSGL